MKIIPLTARQSYFRRKFKKEKKNLESNLNMLDLTSKLEDRELERMMKIKKESGPNQKELKVGKGKN